MQATFNEFTVAVKAKLAEAAKMYNLPSLVTHTEIVYEVRGRVAGQASYRGTKYKLDFNREAVLNYNDDMTVDTIPHEVAHLVCFANPRLGRNHDAGWKRVCRELGGDDSRCHDMTLTPGKQVNRYEYYHNATKLTINVGEKTHRKLQMGAVMWHKKDRTRSPYTPNMLIAIHSDGPNGKTTKEVNGASEWVDYKPTIVEKVKIAASTSWPSGPAVPKIKLSAPGPSKKQKAINIFNAYPHATRGQMIEMFMEHCDLTKAGAATYYQSIKSSTK